MKRLLSFGVVSLLISITTTTLSGGQGRAVNDGVRDRFVGAWRLAGIEEEGADGKIHKADCTGLLVYTQDGHMSVQVMYRKPQANSQTATNAAPVQYAQGGYEASFGTDEIDERAHSSPSTSRAHWCGPLLAKTLTRVYDFFGQPSAREVV